MAVTIKDEDWSQREDIYTDWYTCPKCKEDMIIVGANYCQDCGVKLKWDLSGERELIGENRLDIPGQNDIM